MLRTDFFKKDLRKYADPTKAEILQRFFKTGKGEYGSGDIFLGISVPQQRQIAMKYRDMPLAEVAKLLREKIHEYRLSALILLVDKYKKGDEKLKRQIVEIYFSNLKYVNNWDLVDASAPHLLGHYLRDRPKDPLTRLAASRVLWERRMAIIATFDFIRQGDYDETLRVARLLLGDPEDLIHKAVGWMLREVGKREAAVAEAFLQAHYRRMPRTMLRYAIERFPEARRRAYLKGAVA